MTLELLQWSFFSAYPFRQLSLLCSWPWWANYQFVIVDVGAPGWHSEGCVVKASEFGRQLGNETLDIPKLSRLSNSTKVAPYNYIQDEAFQLPPDFMRPFPGKNMRPCKPKWMKKLIQTYLVHVTVPTTVEPTALQGGRYLL